MYIDAPGIRKPIGILMIEHRLIERGLKALEARVSAPGGRPDPLAFAALIDFFGTYADGVHHGKEEDIMFEAADALNLSAELAKTLAELREDHVKFRGFRRAMDEANRRLAGGDASALADLVKNAQELIPRLRAHIIKEDKVFFPGFDKKQTDQDREAMKARFHAFDAEKIHDAYKLAVEKYE